MIDIDDFKHEIECIYKDEKYAIVRENNADANALLLYDEVSTSPKH